MDQIHIIPVELSAPIEDVMAKIKKELGVSDDEVLDLTFGRQGDTIGDIIRNIQNQGQLTALSLMHPNHNESQTDLKHLKRSNGSH